MTLYRHIHPELTREQQENFVTLARHLVLTVEDRTRDHAGFDMACTALDLSTGDDLQPDQVASHSGPLTCSLLGHGPRAGLKALPGETWQDYQARILGAAFDSPLEDWLTSSLWRATDNTAIGAAMRLMYVLDYGVPGDWELIRSGQAESDYTGNGFLWDRIGLMPPAKPWR